jgi:DNA invertase Pin-like site-specific DNA recombinase
LKPHKLEQWQNAKPDDPEEFAEQVAEVCDLYKQSQELENKGVHLMSTDEKTGIQALERSAQSLAMKSGLVERQEYEYVRHGTQCLIDSKLQSGHRGNRYPINGGK